MDDDQRRRLERLQAFVGEWRIEAPGLTIHRALERPLSPHARVTHYEP